MKLMIPACEFRENCDGIVWNFIFCDCLIELSIRLDVDGLILTKGMI